MKVCILCNSVLPLPAIQMLASNGLVASIGMPEADNGDTAEMQAFFDAARLSVVKFQKKGLDDSLVQWVKKHQADVVFVMTFPWKIAPKALSAPKLGFFNFHYALLPKYRGASPVFWQLRNGETHGGLTIHRMDAGWDTGPIAQIYKMAITPGETFGIHNRRLAWETVQGVATFTQTLMMLGNSIPLTQQNGTEAAYYHRPVAKDLTIDWARMEARQIQQLVEACNPWNKGAFARHKDIVFKIVQIYIKEQIDVYNQKLIAGTVINCSEKKTVDIITVDNKIVSIEVISLEEGIFTADFLVSMGLKEGAVLKNLN